MNTRFIFIVLLTLLLSLPVFAEFYEYRDESGNLRYTDDLFKVPEQQRQSVQTHESVISSSYPPEASGNMDVDESENMAAKASGEAIRADVEESTDIKPAGSDTWDGQLQESIRDLDEIKRGLDETFDQLQKEKAALKRPAPGASHAQITAYEDKVLDLNDRINLYHAKNKEFKEKVKEHNERFIKK